MATNDEFKKFQQAVWEFYAQRGRHDLPWRLPEAGGQFDPYKIVVSEMMLQQTQVARVIPKFESFVRQFPSWAALAAAPLADVLRAWSGLGYNRRAKFLWHTAQQVMESYGGQLPAERHKLIKLPGIGPNTAGAVLAYAFNRPEIFIETNIRTVFIHHFFAAHTEKVTDKQLQELVRATLPRTNPREWFWALMDYGTHLKTTVGAQLQRVQNYRPQGKFAGSRRQIRGQVLKLLGEKPWALADLAETIEDARLEAVLTELTAEGLVRKNQTGYQLP